MGAGARCVTLSGNGSHSIVAKDTDTAGNTGTSAPVIYTLSTIGPTVTESLTIDTGSSATDRITSNDALTGTGLANTAVDFTIDGSLIATTATTDAVGAWSFTPTGLADGAHTIVASQTDAFGNIGTAALSFTLDTAAPAAPSITSVTDDVAPVTGTVASGGFSNDTTPTLAGTAEANSTVTIFDGANQLGTATANGSGGWTFTTAALGQGSHSFTATATDAAGSTGAASSAYSITIDTAAPGVAITSAGGPVGQAAQTISGTGEAGTTVTLFDNGSAAALGTAIVQSNGSWSTLVTLSGNGSHSIVAQDTDTAGNTGTSAPVVYTLSTIGPTVTASLTTDTGSSATDRITSNDALTGTGLANTAVGFTIDGSLIATTATTNAVGAWSFTPTGLADGAHTIVASQTDTFGNIGTAALSFTLDTAAPAAPSITSVTDDVAPVTGTVASGGFTNDTTPTRQPAAARSQQHGDALRHDGTTVLGTATADGSGQLDDHQSALARAATRFTAKADRRGRQHQCGLERLAVTIDTARRRRRSRRT